MTAVPAQYGAAQRLEAHLGDPYDPSTPFAFAQVMAHDEAELYPQPLIDQLYEANFHHHTVPARLGGQATTAEELLALIRVIARRDLTTAIAMGVSILGAIPLWIAGRPDQQERVAHLLLSGQKLGFAITEREHGSDLISNHVRATRTPTGWQISGQKWSWGNATRSAGFTLHAKTADTATARSHSLFFLERAALQPGSWRDLPKITTMGLRAHDLAGIDLMDAAVPEGALIGEPGQGLELVSRTIQFTRGVCAGLAIGSAETALRTATRFAMERQLYGQQVWHLEHPRAVLAEAVCDLWLADALSTATARAWHVLPGEMSLWTSIIKYLIPSAMEQLVRDVGVVLGGRFFMREEYDRGIFQKCYRDLPIVAVFEGNTVIQLVSIGQQLGQLLRPQRMERGAPAEEMATLLSLSAPLPHEIDWQAVDLFTHGSNSAVAGLPATLRALSDNGELESSVARHLGALADQVAAIQAELVATAPLLRTWSDRSPRTLEVARQYALLHAAALAMQFWQTNRSLSPFFASGIWLVVALQKLLTGKRLSQGHGESAWVDQACGLLTERLAAGESLGLIPLRITTPYPTTAEEVEPA